MGRVLVIDSDAARRGALATALGAAAHEVEMAATAEAGAHLARISRPDLVIVDADLPDGNTVDLCRALRRDRRTARALVLVLSASTVEAEHVLAFEAGVDDFVVRPFSTRELMLRIRALLRRVRAGTPLEVIAIAGACVDRGTRRVTVEGVPVALTRREFDLLVRLVDGRGRVLARETIVADVWPENAPSERVVDTTLKRLRRKLPALGRRIRTIRGIGYELSADEADDG